MTVEVRNRSIESWGPLAGTDEKTFNKVINGRDAKNNLKSLIKKQKKLKTYKVTFIKQLVSDQFEVQAETDYDVSSQARLFFNENKDNIKFSEKTLTVWESKYHNGYDQISYVKVKS